MPIPPLAGAGAWLAAPADGESSQVDSGPLCAWSPRRVVHCGSPLPCCAQWCHCVDLLSIDLIKLF